ncbi:MAG: ABC transporter substrate-binding protein [Betaproteobacteria bacterium]
MGERPGERPALAGTYRADLQLHRLFVAPRGTLLECAVGGANIVTRRRFVEFALLSSAGTLSAALAQPARPPKRVGVLTSGSAAQGSPFLVAFEARLAQRGWTLGRDLVIVPRYAEGDPGRLEALARELVAEKVDVIHAVFPGAVRAARKVAPDTPIVFSIVSDPVAEGFVSSLARPGGNITGSSTRDAELNARRLQLIRELLPRAKRVVVLADMPAQEGMSAAGQRYWQEMVATAQKLGMAVELRFLGSVDDVGPAFERMAREGVDAVHVIVYFRLTGNNRRVLTEHAARLRLPAIYGAVQYADMEGLISFAINPPELARRSADYVDKILRGAKPADLPVEEPNAFELVINQKAARALKLTIPQAVLLRADRVIE